MKVGERVACSGGCKAVDRRMNAGRAVRAADGGDWAHTPHPRSWAGVSLLQAHPMPSTRPEGAGCLGEGQTFS